MVRRITSAMIVAMFAVIASVTPAANAGMSDSTGESAVPGAARQMADWEGCPAGMMCLAANIDGNGGGFYWHPNTYTGDFRVLLCGAKVDCRHGPTFHDEASSWWNRTGQNFCVSDGTWGGNPDNTMPANTRGNFTPDWNDRASSIGYLGCP